MIAVLWVEMDGENSYSTLQLFISWVGERDESGLARAKRLAFKRETIFIAGRSCDPAAFDGEAPIRDFVRRQARNRH